MPDELKAIVQRMIDAGEPEANIATVIKGYPQASQAYEPRNILAEGRASAATSGQPEAMSGFQEWFKNELQPVLEKVARPETISDIAALLVPDAAGVVTGARAAARAAGSGAETVGKGLEALGASKIAQRIGTYGAGYAALSGNLGKAAIAAGAPPAATAAGKVLQSGGRFLQDVGARPMADVAPAVVETPAELTARLTAENAAAHGNVKPDLAATLEARPAAPQAQAPTPAPVASPAPTSPAVAAPEAAAVASAPMSTPDAFKAALNAFDTAKVAPQAAEVNNAAMLIKRGVAPEEALKTVMGNRPPPPVNPAEALLKSNPGFKSEAEMNADMAARARRGQKSLMPKYGGEPAPAPQATLAQPVASEPPPVAQTPAPEPAPVVPEPTPTPEPATAAAAKPKRAIKAKAAVVDTPPAAADTPAAAAERVIDVAGAKTGKDVQGRVVSALTEELANAQQAAKFSTIEFSPNAGKTYGYGRVIMDGQPVAFVDKYGAIKWADDSPAYTTAQGKRVAAESTHADIRLEGRMDEKTPGQIAREATAKVAQAVGQENGAGMLRVQIPGDGTFTVPRNPHAIGELIRRLSAGGPSIWQGVGDVKFSAPKVGPEIPKATW